MAERTRVEMLASIRTYFENTLDCLDEADAGYAPVEGMFTAAQHVAHVAQTVEWFLDGAFAPGGFDLNFEHHEAEVRKITSLEEARGWLARAMDRAAGAAREIPDADWDEPIADGPIMGGMARHLIIEGIRDHTAHHRGALAVYARLRGHTPRMPYT